MNEKKKARLINYTKKIQAEYPRNGNGRMDDRAFDLLARRLSRENKAVLKQLADK